MTGGIGYFIGCAKAFTAPQTDRLPGFMSVIRIVLFQPDIPQNVGAVLRLGACFDIAVEIIEPCGFVWDDKRIKRAGMDYVDNVSLTRHQSWEAYISSQSGQTGRLVLFTTKASEPHHSFSFAAGDHLVFGQESAGVPDEVHKAADARLSIPMAAGARSLNLAQSAAIASAEGLRQLNEWPVG
jgi:tRNA (cytidine/uridine-2'-O-)-methyltransferase